jgi:hypothetical protein
MIFHVIVAILGAMPFTVLMALVFRMPLELRK